VAALIAVASSMLVAEALVRRPLLKLVFNTSQHTLAVSVGVWLFLLVGGQSALHSTPKVLPFVVLVVGYFVINKLAVSTVVATVSGQSTAVHWLKSMRGSALYDALSMPLIIVLAVAYARLGASWTVIFSLPVLGIRQLYRTVFALEKVNEELLQLMVASIEARDPYTSGHSQRVSMYAREIARATGLSAKNVERVEIAALLHDVGKIHEEFAAILRKPGRLSDAEFVRMKLHPVRSAELVSRVSHFSDIVSAVRGHHEAWDGSGYPDQLQGAAIPAAARIISVADTIDAMTTTRPYRAGLSLDEVKAELARESGRQFDPEICTKLLVPSAWTSIAAVVVEAQQRHPASEMVVDGIPVLGNTGEFVPLQVS
jgi:putative nucleotidyltransferase with HDIG domain